MASVRVLNAHDIVLRCCCLFGMASACWVDAADESQYLRDIKPLLKTKCYVCHGANDQEGGLRLDSGELIRTGGDSGVVVDLEAPQLSEIVQRVQADDSTRMPPEGEPLTKGQVASLIRWIEAGSNSPADESPQPRADQHWSFQPLSKPEPPASDFSHPIDKFIGAKLADAGLTLSPPASATTIVRRMFLDLHGLPPTPQQVDRWGGLLASDEFPDPHAAAKLADRLLSNPRYGERWAQHWLDIVRYADTHGFEVNTPRIHAWRYRDWVIEAFNNDLPYQEFVQAQIAGDSMGHDPATGFLVAAAVLLPGQIGKDAVSIRLARQDALDEMIVGTSATFLGLTVGCARCHDHKFDPITQRDYYAMQAFFAGVDYGDRPIQVSMVTAIPQDEKEATTQPILDPVNAKRNEDRFESKQVKFVRFATLETIANNKHEPCIDELEVFRDGNTKVNVALATEFNVKLTSSGNYSETGRHQLKHINDGNYGNDHSWISNKRGVGWVQLEFERTETINRVVWGRDRNNIYKDRLPTKYEIAVSLDGKNWEIVASSTARKPFATPIAIGPMAYAGKFRQPDETFVLHRGDPEQRGESIAPAVPGIFAESLSEMPDESRRRQELANWLTQPGNPLTARVIVNRVWQYHFGRGIVDTPSDFGLLGNEPSHPELLDWLANWFVDHHGSIKALHRLIVTSRTYRQSNTINDAAKRIDAGCRLLWRYPSRRLEAEAIRDSILQISGTLNRSMGGPGFDFFKTRGGLSGFPPVQSFTEPQFKRMIYAHKVRMEPVPVFGAFDCPDAGQPMPQRSESTTPIQALNLLNSEFVIEQSKRFAQNAQSCEISKHDRASGKGENIDDQVRNIFLLSLSRAPTDDELIDCCRIASEFGLETVCRAIFNSNEFLFLP